MPAPVAPDPGDGAAGDDALNLRGEGFQIVFHAKGYTGSEFEQPSLSVEAGSVRAENGRYFLEDVKAVVYREGQPSAEMIAHKGEVNEADGTARLSEGVTVNAGDMVLELDHIEWQDKADPPQAVSDAPVHLRRGDTDLEAVGMVLVPIDHTLTLNQVKGRWSSKGTQP